MNAQAHYIRLYKAADEILRQPDNPCNIQKREDGKFTCTYHPQGSDQLCCTGCTHLGPEGCTVMSLGCKLGWCWSSDRTIRGMKLEDHPTFTKISALRDEAVDLRLPLWCRGSYNDAVKFGGFK
jgi:hypothetical protein